MQVPVPKVRQRWRKIALRTLGKAWSDSLFGLSSQAAFWCALSTAPLLLALLGMIGFIVPYYFPAGTIDQVRDQVLLFLNTIFNEEVANNLVGNTVETILGNGQADVSMSRPNCLGTTRMIFSTSAPPVTWAMACRSCLASSSSTGLT